MKVQHESLSDTGIVGDGDVVKVCAVIMRGPITSLWAAQENMTQLDSDTSCYSGLRSSIGDFAVSFVVYHG
jgi:hypothetical protein